MVKFQPLIASVGGRKNRTFAVRDTRTKSAGKGGSILTQGMQSRKNTLDAIKIIVLILTDNIVLTFSLDCRLFFV